MWCRVYQQLQPIAAAAHGMHAPPCLSAADRAGHPTAPCLSCHALGASASIRRRGPHLSMRHGWLAGCRPRRAARVPPVTDHHGFPSMLSIPIFAKWQPSRAWKDSMQCVPAFRYSRPILLKINVYTMFKSSRERFQIHVKIQELLRNIFILSLNGKKSPNRAAVHARGSFILLQKCPAGERNGPELTKTC